MEEFKALGLSDGTVEALAAKGFQTPTPIQVLAIPELLAGSCDLIGQAGTGTGKTAAFGLPIIERLMPGGDAPRALVLSPTRELAMQIADELNSLKGAKNLQIAAFYGGQNIAIQLQRLRNGVDVVIGTPGRVLDLIERGKLELGSLEFAVLDEADEMLDMGFIEDIEAILSRTGENRRMLMFSATMPPEITGIAERFMRDAKVLRAAADESDESHTEQIYYEVKREDKFEALLRIIDTTDDLYAMVFCRTKADVDELAERLRQRGRQVEALHGDIPQGQRTKIIGQFKSKYFRLLAATDVAARGIDVNDLSHVINYSIPQDAETYIHRIGRTGRAGKDGCAITFVTPGEKRKLAAIMRGTKVELRKETMPSGRMVVETKKKSFAEEIDGMIASDNHADCAEFAAELIERTGDAAAALAAMLKLHFKDELIESNYYNFYPQREAAGRRDRSFWESAPVDDNQTRLFIGVGKEDGFGAVKMLDLLWDYARIKKSRIGKIDCFDRFSFVNVGASDAETIMREFNRNRGPRVSPANAPEPEAAAAREPQTAERESAPAPRRARKSPAPAAEKAKPRRRETAKPGVKADAKPGTKAEKKQRFREWVERISAIDAETRKQGSRHQE
ncbi:MAG: DEAD/DEAH box helicase [Victivallaceae bacterium]|nr:DEAD/DEAH box helicase [Victivallaceae bacterium]